MSKIKMKNKKNTYKVVTEEKKVTSRDIKNLRLNCTPTECPCVNLFSNNCKKIFLSCVNFPAVTVPLFKYGEDIFFFLRGKFSTQYYIFVLSFDNLFVYKSNVYLQVRVRMKYEK
ncbi:hypothetical protein ANTPLA_LOCUS3104 [Anthophora plagiata]